MAITFTKAVTVAKGDPITSRQFRSLALAINDRMRSGLGDPGARLRYYMLSACRQPRNPADEYTYPAQAEFFESYQQVNTWDGLWPTQPAGAPEGANVAALMPAFTLGNANGIDSEADRLNIVPLVALGTDAVAIWNLGKAQRGAVDPITGALGSPIFTAARAAYSITGSQYSPHGNSIGGTSPTPAILGSACPPPADGSEPNINYQMFFTSLEPSASTAGLHGTIATVAGGNHTVTYPGTCKNVAGDVAGIASSAWAYYVFLYTATPGEYNLDVLPSKLWIQGPYSGGATLRRQWGNHLDRILANFANEFRGSDGQRAQANYWNDYAFKTQEFFTGQYHLAPAIGKQFGSNVADNYPALKLTSSAPAGTLISYSNRGGTAYKITTGFVFDSYLVSATKLSGPVTVNVMDGKTQLSSVTLTPDANGTASQIMVLSAAAKPSALSFVLGSNCQFSDPTGSLNIEVAELLEYQPEEYDRYTVLRLSTTTFQGIVDGDPTQEVDSLTAYENYSKYGCIINVHDSPGIPGTADGTLNDNAVFESFRRLSQFVRCVPRAQLTGIDLVNGKTSLYFLRYQYVDGAKIDCFPGIAPSDTEIISGQVIAGRQYSPRTGTITYQGATYGPGSTFTGVAGGAEFTGDGQLYEYQGIRHKADWAGRSNEWLMGVDTFLYQPSSSGVYKPAAYADQIALNNRCQSFSNDPYFNQEIKLQSDYGASGNSYGIFSELVSGWNYIHGTNGGRYWTTPQNLAFYKSCRIYEPDVEIDSATVIFQGGNEVVKLTFTGRIHYCDEAVTSFSSDTSTWNVAALKAESYRSLENALREYLIWTNTGNVASIKIGEVAKDTVPPGSIFSGFSNLYGAVIPRFWFYQLMPLPYADGNDTQNAWDTPLLHEWLTQAELYLRVMCEGYIDGETTAAYGCQSGIYTIFTYTFENACHSAFGNRWFTALPLALRADNLAGFGADTNTECYADLFNQFASFVNQLTSVPIYLPFGVQCGANYYQDQGPVPPSWPMATPQDCSVGGGGVVVTAAIYYGTPVPATTLSSTTPLGACAGTFTASCSASISTSGCYGGPTGPNFALDSFRTVALFQAALADPNAVYACPPAWSDMLTTALGALATWTDDTYVIEQINTTPTTTCQAAPGVQTNFGPYQYASKLTKSSTTCGILTSGTIDPGFPVPSWHVCPCDADGATFPNGRIITYTLISGENLALTVPLKALP